MKPKFKSTYILGVGYPWFYGSDQNQTIQVGINVEPVGICPVEINIPQELWDKRLPKYELVLRRVKEKK